MTATESTTEVHDFVPSAKMAIVAMCLGFFVIQLDATIINVALPTIGDSLHGSASGLQWVVAGYTIALAALMLTAGGLADQIGARRMFLLGMIVFAVASAACGLAIDLPMLIASRVVQGIGAAMLLPCSLALIVHQFPDTSQRAKALGIWGAIGSVGMASGPLVGGVLLATVNWRAIFLVNVPVAILAMVLLLKAVEETSKLENRRIDRPGVILGSLSLGALAGTFIECGDSGVMSPTTLSLAVVGALTGIAFIFWERRVKQPMMPPKLFTSHNFTVATTIGFLFNFSLYGALLTMSLYLQHELRYSALLTGCALFPMTLAVASGSIVSGRITAHTGPRRVMMTGLVVAAVGAACTSFAIGHGASAMVPFLIGSVVLGLCSLAMPAMTSVAVGAVEAKRSGLSSGVFNTSRQAGGAIGVALLGSLTQVGDTSLRVPMIGAAIGLLIATVVASRTRAGEKPLTNV